ncbi:DNA-binding PucR family transcriptional regulator [Nocardia sp. GAS34]|uniref:PucR family transcriptional regulator n=1 Tax=unclassified Nocardia TaxID=2637762 RepID=UPI003D1F77F3
MTRARHDDFDADRLIAAIAARMNERVTDVSAAIRTAIEDDIADLRGDPLTGDLLGASVEANVATGLHAQHYGLPVADIQVAPAVVDYTRRLAQQGVPANALGRAYRLGERRMTELVFAELRRMAIPPTERINVVERVSRTLFDYIDNITEQILAIYNDEREHWLESQNSIREMRAREVLASRKAIDVDAVTKAIRYPLRWHHLALILWYPDTETDSYATSRLQRFVRELGDKAATSSNPLVVTADQVSSWAWLPYRTAPNGAITDIRRFVTTRPDAPDIAIGTPAAGIDGFRYTHQSAQRARAVALARRLPTPSVVAADDPGLTTAALLGCNLAETRVWVGEVLGGLACDNENDERLRDTLRVFLRTGRSYKAAATELNLHSNSVRYRIGRAVARRGRPLAGDRLDVELALLVCHWYGPAILRPDPNQ